MRKFSSKAKNKLRRLLPGSKHKSDGTGGDTSGERSDSASSLLRPEPHVVAGGVDTIQEQPRSTKNLSKPEDPESTSASKGENDQEGRKANVERGENTRKDPGLLSDAEIAEGSSPSRGGNDGGEGGAGQAHRPSTLAIPPDLKSDGE
jgi:hypothetical protein